VGVLALTANPDDLAQILNAKVLQSLTGFGTHLLPRNFHRQLKLQLPVVLVVVGLCHRL
jgi:hypothetical protein